MSDSKNEISRNRIITTKRIREFFESHPDREKHKGAFGRWVGLVEEADWRTFADVRSTFFGADLVGDLTVFYIGRNKYRIVAYEL